MPSGLERDAELQNLVSSIVTANGESIFVSPNRTPVATSYEVTTPDFTAGEGGVAAGGMATAQPTSIEFAPIPNTVAEDSGKAFGLTAADKITKFEVETVAGGANLVKTETNLVDNTTVTTKRFYADIDEAMAEAKKSAVPTASPRTIANSDQVVDIKVAPVSINNVAPEVMPEGVSQIRVEPGIVYRSPDAAVDELINIAQQEGWHSTNQDRLYREYEQYVEEARSQQENFLRPTEALDLPKEMYGTDVDGLLRLAAWAKANGYGAIPFKSPAVQTRTIKKFSMQDKFISKLADKYNFPEIDIRDTVDNKRTSNRQGQRSNAIGSGILNLAAGSENPTTAIFPSADYGASFVGEKPVLAEVLPKDAYDIVKAFGWLKIFDSVVGNDPTKDLRKDIDKVDNDTIDAYVEAVGIADFASKTALEDVIYRAKSKIQALGANEPKEQLVKYNSQIYIKGTLFFSITCLIRG